MSRQLRRMPVVWRQTPQNVLALERAVAAGMRAMARQQVFAGAFVQEAAQVGQLGGGFFVGQQDFRRPDLDVAAAVDGQGRLNALIPNPFGEGVGGCGGRGLV